MQITDLVNLPDELIDAQRAGHLVIFAGAGVSRGPPSCLPDFDELAERVAAGTLSREPNEPADRFLGRLRDASVKVHQRAQQLLATPDSKPTDLHRDLLRLFRKPAAVKIVTTNFDQHFTSAAEDLWDQRPAVYTGPALPLGREFYGLVHLHGSVASEPSEHMILTDRDFGRAYITEGWVSRFLVDLFQHHTVLFVGYSHTDPVMGYLARAIDPRPTRFALAMADDNPERWRDFGIKLALCPPADGEDKYAELGKSVAAWADRVTSGALAIEKQVRDIVEEGVPIDPVDADYLADALKDPGTTQFFTRYAESVSWLEWAADREQFKQLFQSEQAVDDIGCQLAAWFARTFASTNSGDDAIDLVTRLGPDVSDALWVELVRALTDDGENRPDGPTLSKWLTLLLQRYPKNYPPYALELLLSRRTLPEDTASIILLFEFLTRPELEMERNIFYHEGGEDPEFRPKIIVRSEEHLLATSWEQLLKPRIQEIGPLLLPIITRHLVHAHRLLVSYGSADENWDPTSLRRSAIGPHEQDAYSKTIDVLIDAARDIGEWYVSVGRSAADTVVHFWDNDGPLLRRLALHALKVSMHHGADEKICWVLERDLLFSFGFKREVFQVLKVAYPPRPQG